LITTTHIAALETSRISPILLLPLSDSVWTTPFRSSLPTK